MKLIHLSKAIKQDFRGLNKKFLEQIYKYLLHLKHSSFYIFVSFDWLAKNILFECWIYLFY